VQTAGGFDLIVFVVVGLIVAVNWIVQRVREQQGEGGAPPSDAGGDEWKPPERLPQPGRPVHQSEFQPRREQAPPRREPPITHPMPAHSKPVRPPVPVSVPPMLPRRGTVSPHAPTTSMPATEDEAAAPLRPAGEAPGMLQQHGDEWMRQEMPTLRKLEVPGMPPPNTVPDAPPPPYVPVPAAVAPGSRRGVRAPTAPASVTGRQRVPYRLKLNPRSMRQAVVLSEVLGRPRGYDL
jgi:hypothetical protein